MYRTKRFISFMLVFCLLAGIFTTTVAASDVPTEAEAYERMIALKDKYPEGMRWTNSNYYQWKGGIFTGGYGCAGFAFILSDAAFGDLPARKITSVSFNSVRVGDILRVNGDTHSVIVLQVNSNNVVIAEGNYNSSIHWGRTLTASEVASSNYMLTRYPAQGSSTSSTPKPTQTPSQTSAPTQTPKPTTAPTQTPKPTTAPTQTPKPTQAPSQTQTPSKTQAPSQTSVPTQTQAPGKTPSQNRCYGDLTMDGTITVNDALTILEYIVNIQRFGQNNTVMMKLADVNHDGKIDVNDALAILEIVVNRRTAEVCTVQ